MKRRLWITLLMLIMTISCLGVLSACKKSKEGPESGIFYYDGEGVEYLISLNSGDKFSFMVRDANKSGTYSLKGENLTLKFNLKSDGKLDATMSEDRNTIVLSYESAEMRFVRKSTCTVTFDSNGGSEVKSVTAVNGKTIERPQDPTRDNYIFVGWFTDAELTSPFVFGTSIVTGDTTLYARWGERIAGQSDFNVSFDLNYENAPALEDKKTTGGHLYVRPQPTREGFAFRGWWVSMYDSKEMVSYAITDDTIIKEDVVAYALWEPASATRLPMPEVWMTDTGVYWNIVSGASAYNIEIEGPAGFAKITETTNTNFYALEWPGVQMGDFKVTVTATSGNSDNASSPAVCYYKNRALARVSRFEVVLSSTLIFNPVEGADYYTITVDCGDESHSHTDLDNGNSTYFNFSNCLMQEGGITFVVTAHGENYMDSVSRTFVYDRSLAKVEGIRVDEETQVLHWNEVPNAADYILEITCPNDHHHPEEIFNGNKTTFDLKECGRGNIAISITPRTKGYNSPEPATFSFTKTRIAAPGNFKLVGTEISWDSVEGAEKYSLLVDGVTRETEDNKFELSNMTNWANTSDYTLFVTAVDETGASSPASEPVDMRYMALYSTVTYYRNVFSWRHVLGATRYEVTLNGESLELEEGKNYVEIYNKFKPGENVFKLKFIDSTNPGGSEEISYTVQAYQITFDARSGECATQNICLAYGDRVELPTATRQGYTLDGWYNAPGGAESNAGRYLDDFYQELGDIILYASWAPERFTITYVYDDGRAGDGTEVTSVFYQRKFVFKLPTSIVGTNGFLGWFSEQGEGGEPLTDQFGVGYEPWDQLQGGQVYAHWAHVFDYTLLSDPSKIGGKIASVRSGPEVDKLTVLTVPAEYDGYPVKQVAGMAFMGHKDIKQINVPDTLILIGVDAFSGCDSLEKVNIYETGTILDEEVQYKSFDGVICKRVGDFEWALNYYPQARSGIYRIPDGVTQIGSGVFNDKPVTEIIIPADVTLVAENAFADCTELTKITFESALDSLKKQLVIENNAFTGCAALRQIVFPRQLYTLGGTPDGYNGIVKECAVLSELNVAEGNIYGYSSRDNMILKDNSIVYVIPDSRKGQYTIPEYVIGVGPYAFAGMDITELTVPKTLRNIDEGAFLNNHELTTITFVGDTISGGQLNLGKYAFRSCDKLVNVIFQEGSTVGTLGSYCFDSCTKLETITLPANLSEIKNNAFNNCTSLKEVNFQAGEVGRDFLTLGRAIFNNCTSLGEIHLPAHVSDIVYGAFDGANNLRGVFVADGGTYSDIDGVLYGNNVTELIYYPKIGSNNNVKLPETVTTIGDSVFKNFTRLTQITIPSNVTYIGAEAFFGCSGLVAVVFEDSDKSLTFGTITDEEKQITGSFAFAGCSALSNLSIPARVTEIPAYFMYYEGASPVKMTTMAIPNSVVEIGEYAFYGARISNVNFSSELQFINEYAFMGTNLTSIDLSNTKLVEIGDSAFEQLRVTSLSLNRNGSLKRIGDRAFYNMRASTVQLSEGLQDIGSEAFAGAPIIMLDFPATLRTLGDNAFKGCISLQRYTIKSDVKFGLTVFAGCTSLFEVNIAEGVTQIPENMLEGTVVKKISLPSTIREIGQYAFANSALESVEFARSIQIDEIGVGAFQNCTALKSINLPEGIRTIGAYAFADCTGLTSFSVCASVTEVGDYAFSGCTELASITFNGTDSSGSLKLGSFVFMNCGKLETIHFPANLTTLNGTIFSGCDMLKNVTFAGAANNMFHDGLLISLDGKELILGLPGADNEEVHVPSTVEYVTNEAFARSRFKRVIFDEGGTNPLTIGSEGNAWTDACNVFANNDFIEEVTFPENLDTIGASAFENCTALRKVNVPARVRYIGAAAFREATHLEELDFRAASLEAIGSQAFYHAGVEGNGISPVTLPEGMREIETDIFSYAGFTELTIPSTVNVINKEAFTYCEKLKKVSFNGPSRIRTIDEGAFRRCDELEEFNLAEESGVLNLISDEAFYLCGKLKAFNLPTSSRLRTIGERAFAYTGIESFTVRSTIMAIEPFAFSGCSNMKTLIFEDGKYQLEMGDFTRTEISRFEAGTFQFCTSLEEVQLPERMTNIGTRMFAYCESLRKVTLPASMKHMTDGMFANCSGLKELIIPDGTQLEWIGRDVFTEGGPENFVIPASVKTIENNALMNAKGIKNITFADGIQIEGLMENMFAGCESLERVNFGNFHYDELPRAIFSGCKSLVEFTIPKHIEKIPGYAFRWCESLQHIYFEDGAVITEIEGSAFEGAGPFEIKIPKTVTTIGDSAFYGSAVKKVEFEERNGSAISIGANAFGACTELSTFTIPENATLGMHTFRDSTGLKEIILATSMKEIPEFMLTGCKNLETIKFAGNRESNSYLKVTNNIIYSNDGKTLYVYACSKTDTTFNINNGVTTIARGAFSYTTNLQEITIGNSVTKIDHDAFQNSSIRKVTIQGNPSYGSAVFAYCENLQEVDFGNSCTTIGGSMFIDCKKLNKVTWGNNLQSIGGNAFDGSGIRTISDIPATCTTVEAGAFKNTPNLEKVKFNSNGGTAVTIGVNAFEDSGLTEATLPTNLSTQYVGSGQYMFKNCHNLKTVSLPTGNEFTVLPSQMFCFDENLETLTGLDQSKVTRIEPSAFQGCKKLTEIKFPEGLKSIEEQAFMSSGITSATIPSSVNDVSELAFADCTSLREVKFNDPTGEVDSIAFGPNAFEGCNALETLKLPERKIELTGGNLFGNGGGIPFLKSIEIPEAMDEIPANFFANCIGLEKVTFKNNKLKRIKSYAFMNTTALKTITIPSSVTLIDTCAFEGSGLETVTIPAVRVKTALSSRAFANCTKLTSINFADGFACDQLSEELFAGCSALKEVKLPDCVTSIQKGAFSGCSAMTKFEAPGVTTIHPQAFYGCSSLETLNLPKGRTFGNAGAGWNTEEDSAFYGCVKLKEVQLISGESTRDISFPAYAFYGCESLERINTGAKFTGAGNYAFYGCKNLVTFDFTNLKSIGQYAFYGCEKIESVILQSTELPAISDYAFAENKALKSVTVGSASVTSIGERAFENCTSLTAVHLQAGLTTIGKYAFSGCTVLETLTIPASVNSIDDSAFKGVKKFDCGGGAYTITDGVLYNAAKTELIAYFSDAPTFSVPNSVEVIAESAFAGTGISSITISANVEEIGAHAFDGCEQLNNVTFGGGSILKTLGEYMFNNTPQLTSITLPDSINDFGSHVFSGSSIKNLTIPASTNKISQYAFEGSALEGIIVPANVTIIEEGAFMNSKNLQMASISANVTNVGDYMFAGCEKLEFDRVSLPEGVKNYSKHMFEGCLAFKEITIPTNIVGFGSYCFNGCTNLEKVILHDSFKHLGDANTRDDGGTSQYIFAGTSLTELDVPISVSGWCFEVSEHMFDGIHAESFNLKVKDNVTKLGTYMFANIENDKFTVELPSHITAMGDYMFSGTKIKSYTLSSKLTSLGKNAFEKTALETFKVEGQSEVGGDNIDVLSAESIFAGLTSSTFTLELPAYIKAENLGDYMFEGLDTTTFELKLPEHIEYLPEGAFRSSEKLESVTITGNLKSTTEWAEKDEEHSTPDGGFAGSLFEDCTNLKSATLPDSLELLGAKTFLNCSSLTSFTIGANVKKIAASCFEGCTSLENLTVPAHVTYVGNSAFRGWKSTQHVEFQGSTADFEEFWRSGAEGVDMKFNNNN